MMNRYTITFHGRLKSAIGIFYRITDTAVSDSLKNAIIKLYDKYDSVQSPKLTKVEKVK